MLAPRPWAPSSAGVALSPVCSLLSSASRPRGGRPHRACPAEAPHALSLACSRGGRGQHLAPQSKPPAELLTRLTAALQRRPAAQWLRQRARGEAPRVAPPAGRGKATRVSCGCPITAPHVGWRGLETPHTDPLGSEAGRLTSAAAGACGAPLRLVQLLCPPEALACPSASARGPPSLSHIFL